MMTLTSNNSTIIKIVICFFLLAPNAIAQVNFRDFVRDSILTKVDSNYTFVKQFYINLDSNSRFAPKEMEKLLIASLQNNDTTFFLHCLPDLKYKYGFTISVESTLELYNIVHRKNLIDKVNILLKDAQSQYFINNTQAYSVHNIMNKAFDLDQIYRDYYGRFRFNEWNNDLINKSLDSMLYQVDLINFLIIEQYCTLHNGFINNFDFGNGSYEKVQLIFAHVLRHKNSDYTKMFELLNNYAVKAYRENKISSDIFRLFDALIFKEYGFQYFGFVENAQVNKNLIVNIKGPYYK